jgi:hypothetical protein
VSNCIPALVVLPRWLDPKLEFFLALDHRSLYIHYNKGNDSDQGILDSIFFGNRQEDTADDFHSSSENIKDMRTSFSDHWSLANHLRMPR